VSTDRIEKVLFLITIDTECDHDPQWARSDPLTFHSITQGLPGSLQPVFEATGAVPTYLLTVEVMEDDESVDALRTLKGQYELGTHLHSAFIEPEKKFQNYAGIDSPDFECHCPPDIEYRKLENLTRLFENRFGHLPKSFRAGRYGAGANTLDALERLGYAIDTSVTPYIRWPHPDGAVDYRRAPEQPYYPAAGSLIQAGDYRNGRLLEIPVSMRPRWVRGPRWLRPWFSGVSTMKDVIRYQLRRHRDQPTVVLNMMFHSMEMIPKASPYPQSDEEVKRFLSDLAEILQWSANEGFEFCGAADTATVLKPGGYG
jgi:hypothetical protein